MNSLPVNHKTLIAKLDGVRPSGSGHVALCPCHDDHDPSLSISVTDDKVLAYCHACGASGTDICQALGLEPHVLFDSSIQSGHLVEVERYQYTDADGSRLFDQVRYSPKDFRLRMPGADSGGISGAQKVLYRLPEVAKAVEEGEQIVIVEGEKDADRLAALGFVATTSPMGAGKWRPSYTEVLAGAKVAIIPDNDTPGLDHANTIASALASNGHEVRIVALDGLPLKGDVTDWIKNGGTPTELKELIRNAPIWEPDAYEDTGANSEDGFESARINFDGFFTRERPEADFLVEPIWPRGRSISIVSKHKQGKSLLAGEIGAALATGRDILGRPGGDPVRVMYLDMEMAEEDLYERLQSMGYTEQDEALLKDNLIYYSLPQLPPLDTREGGQFLYEAAIHHQTEAVIIDTASRVVEGDENSNDTWQDLYRNTLLRLKQAGISLARLDHLGKDESAGARGGSSKGDDVDVQWTLKAELPRVTLRTKGVSRINWVPAIVELTRHETPHTTHTWEGKHVVSQAELDVAELLVRLDIPLAHGRGKVRKRLKELAAEGVITQDQAAIRDRTLSKGIGMRRDRENRVTFGGEQAGTGPGTGQDTPLGTGPGTGTENPSTVGRNSYGNRREQVTSGDGNSSHPIGGNSSPSICICCGNQLPEKGYCVNPDPNACDLYGARPEAIERWRLTQLPDAM